MPADEAAKVTVIGGGTMGAGIAQQALTARCAVTVVESDAAAAEAALERVVGGLRLAFKRSDDPEAAVAEARARLDVATSPDGPEPSLVVEALPEIIDLKARVLGDISRRWSSCLLASNTSSLSVTALAADLASPERFLGMHFFNPVPRSLLVELVIAEQTDADALARARTWVQTLGKESIEVADRPGFATSRLGVAIGLEAIRMVEEGVASAADIDRGMVLGYKFPIGPLELTDLVGLDVRLAIAEHLSTELGDRFTPPSLLRSKVAAGELGKKSGLGFYDWSDGKAAAR